MLRYAVNRVIAMIPLLVGLSVLIFFYVHIVPGDPILGMLGAEAMPGQAEQLRHQFGLDRPLTEQFVDWVRGLVRGDLGVSFFSRQKITPMIINRIGATVELALGGLLLTVGIGVPAGIIAGLKKNTMLDHAFSLFSLAGLSMPGFWLGTMMVIVLGVKLRVLPTGGYVPFSEDPKLNLTYLLMPALSVAFGRIPYLARMTRASVIETMQEPFVAFASAKGLREKTLLFRYVLRHAICQVVVVLAMQMGSLLGGSVLIEELFFWPGMGRVSIGAVRSRDYFVMQACLLIYSGLFLGFNLLADLIHAWLDPRIQLK